MQFTWRVGLILVGFRRYKPFDKIIHMELLLNLLKYLGTLSWLKYFSRKINGIWSVVPPSEVNNSLKY
jgi:hypothetical protein